MQRSALFSVPIVKGDVVLCRSIGVMMVDYGGIGKLQVAEQSSRAPGGKTQDDFPQVKILQQRPSSASHCSKL